MTNNEYFTNDIKVHNLENNLLFQQDNATCHKSQESMEAIEILFGKNKI